MPFFCSLFVHYGPPTCVCVPESASISSWALIHLSQLVLMMIHIATDSCLLTLFSCRLHGCNYHSVIGYIMSAIGYIIKHHQCNFCWGEPERAPHLREVCHRCLYVYIYIYIYVPYVMPYSSIYSFTMAAASEPL